MLTVEPIPRVAPPPRWRTVLLMVIGFLGSLLSMAFSPAASAMTNGGSDFAALHMFVSTLFLVLGPMTLGWRHRRPLPVAVGTALLSLIIPIGNTIPLIALSTLIGRRRGTAVVASALLTLATSGTIVVIDAMQQPRIDSLLKTTVTQVADDEYINLAPATIVAVILIGWGLSVAFGLIVRNQRLRKASEAQAFWMQEESAHLNDDLARQAERELIAREIHDGLGHRLSILNLHAGALEAKAKDNPEIQESARLVRATASGAMDDLRTLLGILHPDGTAQQTVALRDMQRVVSDSFGAEQPLSSSIFIEDADGAHPRLANAVYRIVQELLTNARKHAPGQRIELTVVGGPSNGIKISAANRLATRPITSKGAGRGLTGINERVRLLGGTMEHSTADGRFRVDVQLPWMAR